MPDPTEVREQCAAAIAAFEALPDEPEDGEVRWFLRAAEDAMLQLADIARGASDIAKSAAEASERSTMAVKSFTVEGDANPEDPLKMPGPRKVTCGECGSDTYRIRLTEAPPLAYFSALTMICTGCGSEATMRPRPTIMELSWDKGDGFPSPEDR